MRPLSKKIKHEIDVRQDLWELTMNDLKCDYYRINKNIHQIPPNSVVAVSPDRPFKRARTGVGSPRRSGRLRPATPKDEYIHHYCLLLSRNESALLELQERAQSYKKPISLSLLKKLLSEYEPIAINRRVRTGGTFLVEVLRARYVQESVILKCIKLLVANGANPNIASAEMGLSSASATEYIYEAASGLVGSIGKELYPLIIAAARGMCTVVKYLLEVGANRNLRGSSRFRLYSNSRKSVKGMDLTALEFALKMKDNELENGIKRADLRGLLRTISLLEDECVPVK
jgi:hypothetical protein